MTPVGVAELKAAWRALEAGAFAGGSPWESAPPTAAWVPGGDERVIAVLGCGGSVGASTVALALATASEQPARLVECCPPDDSGLAAAASAELGEVDGWRRGSRGPVLIERRLGHGQATPAATTVSLTILDADASVLRPDAAGWLPTFLATQPPLLLVTRPTVPALRCLETCLSRLPDPHDCLVVTVGPPLKRWPRQVRCGLGVLAGDLAQAGRIMPFPEDRPLAYTGLTPDPLPAPLINAARHTLTLLLGKEPS